MGTIQSRVTIRSLFVLTAMIGFVCFWITWPKRAAIAFLVERHANQKVEGVVNPFQSNTPEWEQFNATQKRELDKRLRESQLNMEELVSHKRSLTDMVMGRQTFDFGLESFTICRGDVVWGPESFWAWPGGRSYR